MKSLLILFTLVCFLPLWADDAAVLNPPSTGFVKTLAKTQAVVIKAYSNVGSFTGKSGSKIDIRAFECSVKGLKSYAISINGAFVDSDEITPLLAGIDSLLKVDKTTTKLDYFDASYTTRGGICFSRFDNGYPDGGKKINIGEPNDVSTFDLDELIKIKALIQKAQAKLQSIQWQLGQAGLANSPERSKLTP